jgi:hypothetical protein
MWIELCCGYVDSAKMQLLIPFGFHHHRIRCYIALGFLGGENWNPSPGPGTPFTGENVSPRTVLHLPSDKCRGVKELQVRAVAAPNTRDVEQWATFGAPCSLSCGDRAGGFTGLRKLV